MEFYLYIADFENGRQQETFKKYDLLKKNNIVINEFSFVHFEIRNSEPILPVDITVFFGNTSFELDNNYNLFEGTYIYRLNFNIYKGFIFNSSKNTYEINNYSVSFYQLFLNDLGFVKPQIQYKEELINSLDEFKVNSIKISDENFDIIIKYLMFNNYFDESIIYKTSLPTEFSDFQNSLLESLKFLYAKIQNIGSTLKIFELNSLKRYNKEHVVLPYDSNSIVDNESFDWLFQNLDVIQKSNISSFGHLKINSSDCVIQEISQVVSNNDFNSYENRLILGYVNLYVLKLNEYKDYISQNKLPRTRYSNDFQSYLILKYNEIIELYIGEIINMFNVVNNYFRNVLKVEKPLIEFPKNLFSFTSTPQYFNWFELIRLFNNLFSKEIKKTSFKSSLEIESFDKLFEVYVFYILKDVLSLNFNMVSTNILVKDKNNKLAGSYRFKNDNDGMEVTLYYETLPEDIHILTNSKYNPDYVVEFSKNGFKEFVILDAKYKKYKTYSDRYDDKYKSDVKELSFKYLHGLGVVNEDYRITGLYLLSISDSEKFNNVFKSRYNILNSETPVFPSIGGVGVNPKNFNVGDNLILDIILKHKELFKSKCSNFN